ncbi:hypothetical protein [Lutimonas halocynthiae]|uniref:hypothetical protein n=1 Tax=Lutimonas halocynthiae TaxID=1446477 RepID=UPI0025B2E05B|nr:hypothetical protein [Lutimonas halocynthiae]
MIDLIRKIESFLQVTRNGYVEHFIGGILIGAIVSYFVFKKTHIIWVALFFGIVTSSFIGLAKELIDPYLRGDRDKLDLIFTSLGGILGSMSYYISRKLGKFNK